MTELLATLLDWTGSGSPAAVATIVAHQGSTPRSAGAKMILDPSGRMAGTVGGGLVEARVMEAAHTVLRDGTRRMVDFDLSGELAAGADMICGGRLRVFLERVSPGPEAALFAELLAQLRRGRSCLLASPLSGGERTLLTGSGPAAPHAGLPAPLLELLALARESTQAPVLADILGQQWFLEPWTGPSPLYIAGAGHVSRPTAAIAAMAGFAVTVMDDRPEFANAQRFPGAAISTLPMETCLEGLSLGAGDFVVIVTRGHVHDACVLAQALRTGAGYIGMIGSRRKREAVYENLRAQGFTDADFARVRCPIGLPIGAQTPEEIAVSIVAELIATRAGTAP